MLLEKRVKNRSSSTFLLCYCRFNFRFRVRRLCRWMLFKRRESAGVLLEKRHADRHCRRPAFRGIFHLHVRGGRLHYRLLHERRQYTGLLLEKRSKDRPVRIAVKRRVYFRVGRGCICFRLYWELHEFYSLLLEEWYSIKFIQLFIFERLNVYIRL